MTKNELGTAITWTEDKIKEVDKSKQEIYDIERQINEARERIIKIRGNINWQKNRSRQADTICKRGL